MNIQSIKIKITPILKDQGVIKAAVFGSYATGEAKQSSDVDLLVELDDEKSLFDLIGLKLDMEDKLKKILRELLKQSLKSRFPNKMR